MPSASQTRGDVFPEAISENEHISREEEAEALIKAFFTIAEEWGLTPDDARALLGNPGKTRFYELRKGTERTVHGLSDDELDRLAYITGIYYSLGILFSPENRLRWLCNPAQTSDQTSDGRIRPWGMGAPLEYLRVGKMEHLIDVYRYVNGLRGNL